LEDLLPLDVLEPGVEVPDAGGDVLKLVLVRAVDFVGFADNEVEGELDAAVGLIGGEPRGATG
jgi:hypothetical protein